MSASMKSSQSPQTSPTTKSSRGVMNYKKELYLHAGSANFIRDLAFMVCSLNNSHLPLAKLTRSIDGVPKKRGPKKESLSALIKRIDGLEELLKSDKTPTPPGSDTIPAEFNDSHAYSRGNREPCSASSEVSPYSSFNEGSFPSKLEFPTVNAEGLVEVYFKHFHCNPYQVLCEEDTRQKLKTNQLPKFVLYAICAVATRFCEQPGKGPSSHVSADTYATWSQREMEMSDDAIDICQAQLLLTTAFAIVGNGKKAYSLLFGTSMALELYHYSDLQGNQPKPEDETKMRLFWTCYIMNVSISTWLERPSMIDEALVTTIFPSSRQLSQNGWLENNNYSAASKVDRNQVLEDRSDPDYGLQKLVWISQILSQANRYLLTTDPATQGAYGHRHKILRDLDLWAADMSRGPDYPNQLLDGPQANLLLEGRIIYHLVHCLIYRPLLPLHLGEPAGAIMTQHWVAEATELSFRHATAIIELVGQTIPSNSLQLPPFVGYCIFTAGTIHTHGMHFANNPKTPGLGIGLPSFGSSPIAPESFSPSLDLFHQCLSQLSTLSTGFESARLYKQRLEELNTEHSALMREDRAGYTASRSNRFFRRYSDTLRQKIQGFLPVDVSASTPTEQHPPESPHEQVGKPNFSKVAWDADQYRCGGRVPFAAPRPSVAPQNPHVAGHSRSFSDSTSLSQSYSFGMMTPASQRQLPPWTGLPEATPRRLNNHEPVMLGTEAQPTTSVHPQVQAANVAQEDWAGVKEFTRVEPLTYDVLSGAVTAAGSTYQPEEGLPGSYVQFQSFSVL
ncbi:hypothetical protein CCHL11_09070 [Colletotrichum chlorophyti]|uniref:Xylanolytic transcriptional activator regulatory domain-containing protein n=1 Tax=Colletotrichum chlorophyti TaxID=708187 RepID=A0A1Q8RXQ2_9PEZI|nr:hypothetical protein CCHL11_09070 [Colletotrichum chlorophyti]